jgi:hypothetical protein
MIVRGPVMRIILSFLIITSSHFIVSGQNYFDCNVLPNYFVCYSQVWMRTLDPVQDTNLIILDTLGDNWLWQRGPIGKAPFVDVGSTNGIVTDSVAPYPSSVRAHFTVKIPNNDTVLSAGAQFILFEHRFDTDSNDRCYLEYSCDYGLNWSKIRYWNAHEITPGTGPIGLNEFNFYYLLQYPEDSISLFGFRGEDSGWMTSGIQLVWLSSMFSSDHERDGAFCEYEFNDTLYVRFVFESDSVLSNRAGWMIRGITIGTSDQRLESVGEPVCFNTMLIQPNPTTGLARINLKQVPQSILVFDLTGRDVKRISGALEFDISELPAGTYLVKAISNSVSHYGRVIKD